MLLYIKYSTYNRIFVGTADLNDRNEAFSGSDDDSDDDENAEQPNQDVSSLILYNETSE